MCWGSLRFYDDEIYEEEEEEHTVRTGTVITVGRLAATVAEQHTQRQYYALLEVWGPLHVGDGLSFRADPTHTVGTHYVGSKKYKRYHCLPLSKSRELQQRQQRQRRQRQGL